MRCKNKYCLDCGTKNEKNNNSIMKIYPTEDFNGFYYICYKCCRSLEIIEKYFFFYIFSFQFFSYFLLLFKNLVKIKKN